MFHLFQSSVVTSVFMLQVFYLDIAYVFTYTSTSQCAWEKFVCSTTYVYLFYQIYRENYKHLNMLHDESNNILSHISNREKSTYTNFDQQIIHIIYKFRIWNLYQPYVIKSVS